MNIYLDTDFEELTPADPVAFKAARLAYDAEQAQFRALTDDDDVGEAAATCLRYDNAEQALLALPAPDLDGVIFKLQVIFGEDLWDESDEAMQKATALGDLRRIEILSS